MYDPVHNNSESYKVLVQVSYSFQLYIQLAYYRTTYDLGNLIKKGNIRKISKLNDDTV